MRKEVLKRLLPSLGLLFFLSLINWQYRWELISLWVGGLIGVFLLDLDHLIYCFWQYPHQLTSQRLKRYFQQGEYLFGLKLLFESQKERKKLIFHSVIFQLIFLVATFFVLSSSAGLLGKGVVLVMFLEIIVSQFDEFLKTGKMDSWFWQLKISLASNFQVLYLLVMFLIFFGFSLFLI